MINRARILAFNQIAPLSCQLRMGGPKIRWVRIFSAMAGDDRLKAQMATSSIGVVGRIGKIRPVMAKPTLIQPRPK